MISTLVVSIRPATEAAILQGGSGDLGRVDDAGLDHIHILARVGVVTDVRLGSVFQQFGDDHVAVAAADCRRSAVSGPSGRWRRYQSRSSRRPWPCLGAFSTSGDRPQENDAAAGDDAFFGGRPRGVQGIVEQVLAFLHLGFGRGAGLDDGDAAGQLGQTLLELLAS